MSDTDGQRGAFRVMLRMQINPGMEAEFEQTWYAVAATAVTGHPANLGQWLSKSNEEDGVYYIVSDWADEPLPQFEYSERHLQHRTKLHPYRSGGSMTTM